MPSTGQENLETVMIDFFGALRRGLRRRWRAARSRGRVAGAARGVGLQGAPSGDRDLPLGLEQRREIDALEFTRGRDQVVMGARGASITKVGGEPLEGQIFNVFSLRKGRIVRIDDYRRRHEALTAAGLADDAVWR